MDKIKQINFFNKFVCIILIISLSFLLTGCTRKDSDILSDKIYEELDLIQKNIYDIVYKYAEGKYTFKIADDEKIENAIKRISEEENNNEIINEISNIDLLKLEVLDFDKIKEDLKKINNSLKVSLIDLAEKNIETNEVLELSNKANTLLINVNENNINNVLIDLNSLEKVIIKNYESLFLYNEETNPKNESNKNSKKIDLENDLYLKKVKSQILDIFITSQSMENNLDENKEKMNNLLNEFSNKMKDQKFVNENLYMINNIYVGLEEFKLAIDYDDKEFTKLKYTQLINLF